MHTDNLVFMIIWHYLNALCELYNSREEALQSDDCRRSHDQRRADRVAIGTIRLIRDESLTTDPERQIPKRCDLKQLVADNLAHQPGNPDCIRCIANDLASLFEIALNSDTLVECTQEARSEFNTSAMTQASSLFDKWYELYGTRSSHLKLCFIQ